MSNFDSDIALIQSDGLITDNIDDLLRKLGIPEMFPEELRLWRWHPNIIKKHLAKEMQNGAAVYVGFFAILPPIGILLSTGLIALMLESANAIVFMLLGLVLGILALIPAIMLTWTYEKAAKRIQLTGDDKRSAVFKYCKKVIDKYDSALFGDQGKFPQEKINREARIHQVYASNDRLKKIMERCAPESLEYQEVQNALNRLGGVLVELSDDEVRFDQRRSILSSCVQGMREKLDQMDARIAIEDCISEVVKLEQDSTALIKSSGENFYQIAKSLADDINRLNEAFGFPTLKSGTLKVPEISDESSWDLITASLESEGFDVFSRGLPELETIQ